MRSRELRALEQERGARDREIYLASLAGETDAEIGLRLDIPRARVRDAVTRERAKQQARRSRRRWDGGNIRAQVEGEFRSVGAVVVREERGR